MGTFVAITEQSFMFIEHKTKTSIAEEAQTLARAGHKATITCLALLLFFINPLALSAG